MSSAITHSDLALDPQILPSDILDRTAIPIPRLDKETGEVVRAVPDVHVTEAADDEGFQLQSPQGSRPHSALQEWAFRPAS